MSADEGPYAAALCRLPGMGPATLVALLGRRTPRQVWEQIEAGALARTPSTQPALWPGAAPPGPAKKAREWEAATRRIDPEQWWAPMTDRGIGVTWWGAPTYPAALIDDPEPPGVLFWRGSLTALDRPCVALVGTRRATPDGRAIAFELGRDLAAAGVCVVSGLALGIDGAAHAGAVRGSAGPGGAGTVGVAANGVDVPYPRRHLKLWEEVVAIGAVVSETLPGAPAEAWRFPVRNRIIAGLSRMVVIVESHRAGGSLITAEAALARGVELRAVPGSVHSAASAGSNQLLYDGPGPVRSARDVLDGLGLFRSDPPAGSGGSPPALPADQRRVLDGLGWRPATIGQIIQRSELSVAGAMAALDRLEQSGRVGREGDWWIQRSVPP